MARFSPQEMEMARQIFSGEDKEHPPCPDCGGVHARACPRVRSDRVIWSATAQNADGSQVVVEREVHYWEPGTWEGGVIFAPDAFADEPAGSDESAGHDAAGEGSGELVGSDRAAERLRLAAGGQEGR
jgi:hypothetical protein